MKDKEKIIARTLYLIYTNMLTQQDLKQLAQKGISEQQIETQLGQFKTGFPFLKLEAAAAIGHGIIAPDATAGRKYVETWQQYKAAGRKVVKFVPASGAASRMFKDMFAFVDADYDAPQTAFEKDFFEHIRDFAFREALCKSGSHAAGRKIGIRNKTGPLLDCCLVTLVYQFLTECGTSAALPHDGRIYRLARILVPNNHSFTLVDQRNRKSGIVILGQLQLLDGSNCVGVYFFGIGLNPVFSGMIYLMRNYLMVNKIKLLIKQQSL